MELNVRIERDLPTLVPDAISFETGASQEQTQDPCVVAYNHHGEGFSTLSKGALPSFYEDLLLGRAMPLTLATTGLHDVDTLTAIALFLHRDLATHPSTASFVYSVDFVHRLGLPAIAHVPEDFARFVSTLRTYFPDQLSKREFGQRLTTAVGWIREYIHEGILPTLGALPCSDVRILDIGTTGFVLAETQGDLLDGWVELFRQGHLRGLLTRLGAADRNHVLVARKSLYLDFDLSLACRILNEMETAMGEPPEWFLSEDRLWLASPKEGTLILTQHLVDVLVRI